MTFGSKPVPRQHNIQRNQTDTTRKKTNNNVSLNNYILALSSKVDGVVEFLIDSSELTKVFDVLVELIWEVVPTLVRDEPGPVPRSKANLQSERNRRECINIRVELAIECFDVDPRLLVKVESSRMS